ncbi:hypothetical protein C8J57DRAFT_1363178 [Mycena rebaudengoi]|nr:hypothetical protein C8J57DRAFT_1363178 [Mycena rebaudengoi]
MSTNDSIVHVVHAIHPDNEAIFNSLASTRKKIREVRSTFDTACTACLKHEGVELRQCARCKSTWYCSKECQKMHWPRHKKFCTPVEGSGILKLVQTFASNSVLMRHLQACLVLHFDLLRNPHLDKPFMARIDIGIEPADMPEFCRIYLNQPVDTVMGMVQINAFTPLTSTELANLTPMRHDMWRTARDQANEAGNRRNPVGLLEFAKGFSEQTITIPVYVSSEALQLVRESSPWVMRSAITGAETESPFNIETCMEFMNTHIRSDKKNKLLLRTEMLPADIEIIRNAGRGVDGNAVRDLKAKMARETIYKSLLRL